MESHWLLRLVWGLFVVIFLFCGILLIICSKKLLYFLYLGAKWDELVLFSSFTFFSNYFFSSLFISIKFIIFLCSVIEICLILVHIDKVLQILLLLQIILWYMCERFDPTFYSLILELMSGRNSNQNKFRNKNCIWHNGGKFLINISTFPSVTKPIFLAVILEIICLIHIIL